MGKRFAIQNPTDLICNFLYERLQTIVVTLLYQVQYEVGLIRLFIAQVVIAKADADAGTDADVVS